MKITSKEFVKVLFTFQHELKMYHWRTYEYPRHKATDKLMRSLLEFIDLFVESYMGKYERVDTPENIQLRTTITDKNAISKLMNPFLSFLKKWKKDLKGQGEFINLIEEIQTQVEQTKYLMTLK
jgi:mannitol-1-phosphate/altronate dehydrogenase